MSESTSSLGASRLSLLEDSAASFSVWSARIKSALTVKELWRYVDPDADDRTEMREEEELAPDDKKLTTARRKQKKEAFALLSLHLCKRVSASVDSLQVTTTTTTSESEESEGLIFVYEEVKQGTKLQRIASKAPCLGAS